MSQPGVEGLFMAWRDSSWFCGGNDSGILLPAVLTAEEEPEMSLSTQGETW